MALCYNIYTDLYAVIVDYLWIDNVDEIFCVVFENTVQFRIKCKKREKKKKNSHNDTNILLRIVCCGTC